MDPAVQPAKIIEEQNEFINSFLADNPNFKSYNEVEESLRAVIHVLRDRLSIQESFHVLSQLPVFMKLFFIEGWKYRDKPIRIESNEEFRTAVEEELLRFGGRTFERMSIDKVRTLLYSLRRYLSEGEIRDVLASIPPELHSLFAERTT